MTKSNHNTRRSFTHLSDTQRGKLEILAKEGIYTQQEMANELGVSQSTISRELKRGRTQQMNSYHIYYEVYLADSGARIYKENRKNSRAKDHTKYSRNFFNNLPNALISTDKKARIHSVDSYVHRYRRDHPDEHVPCTKTVYNLIDKGVLSVKNIDLPMKTRMRSRKNKRSEPKGSNKIKLGRSIEERDPDVLLRKEFGHWEADLVLGKKAKNEPVIITLLERKSRHLLTKKVWGRSAEKISKATLELMQKHGLEHFKTLTTDNGSEFSTLATVEDQVNDLNVFFTHAYAAWEKGSNERHNGLLREFVPKGKSLKGLRHIDLNRYTDALNQRPRRILDYLSPAEVFLKETKQMKSVS